MPRKKKEPCRVYTSDKHYKAIQWCFKNNIIIKGCATKDGKVRLEIHNSYIKGKKRITFSPESYTQCESSQKIWDLYVKLFEKYNKNFNFK